MMHRSIDKKLRLFFYLILFLFLSTQITKNKNIKNNSNIRLNSIEVIGLSEKNNLKLFEVEAKYVSVWGESEDTPGVKFSIKNLGNKFGGLYQLKKKYCEFLGCCNTQYAIHSI